MQCLLPAQASEKSKPDTTQKGIKNTAVRNILAYLSWRAPTQERYGVDNNDDIMIPYWCQTGIFNVNVPDKE